jgi:hypothetical protein
MSSAALDARIAALGDAADGYRQALLAVEISRCDIEQLAAVKRIVSTIGNCGDAAKATSPCAPPSSVRWMSTMSSTPP